MSRDKIDVMNLLSKKKEAEKAIKSANIDEIPLSSIEPPNWQPRQKFEQDRLKELAFSIKSHGLLQPLVVEKEGDEFRLISGERRYRALKLNKANTVPVRILGTLTQEERIQIQIAENLQREDITPMERSRAVYRLFQMQVNPVLDDCLLILTNIRRAPERVKKEIADTVSAILDGLAKTPRTVQRWLMLLKLPPELQTKLDDPNGVFTPKHAGEILKLADIKSQLEVASLIESENLSADQTKEIIKEKKDSIKKDKPTSPTLFVKTTTKWLVQVGNLNLVDVKPKSKEILLKEIEKMEIHVRELKSKLLG
jgi:ParB family transcriptional regulator, chromosome partitioning protein